MVAAALGSVPAIPSNEHYQYSRRETINFAVIIPTMAVHGWFDRVMTSLQTQNPVRADTLIIQQSGAVEAQCARWEPHATICKPGKNLGLSGAWNYGLQWAWSKGHQVALLLNDDLILSDPRTLTILRDIYLCCPRQMRYLHDRGFSAVCISKVLMDECGGFDEGFNIYFEDNDYHRRLILAGVPWDDVRVETEHFGSATIKSDPDINRLNGQTFPLNQERYMAKWGGGPGQERYTVPWDGKAPWPATLDRVSSEVRQAWERPYETVLA